MTGVSPIRVATAADESDLGSSVSVRFAGFGLTSSGPTTLLHAGTATVTKTTSAGSADWTQSGAPATVCAGDSGGPLVAKLPSGERRADRRGIVWRWWVSQQLQLLGRFGEGHLHPERRRRGRDPEGVGSPTTGPAPLAVTFDLTGSHISDFRAATYLVDPTFDINHPTSFSANAVTSSTPVVHFTYTQTGTYMALVEVFDATSPPQSRIASAALVTITVTEPPPPDTQAPETSIVSNPPDPSNSASPSFGFDGDDNGGSGVAGFECKLDSDPFAACTSPQDYTTASATAATPSRCWRSTRPATSTPRRPRTRGRSTPSRRTRSSTPTRPIQARNRSRNSTTPVLTTTPASCRSSANSTPATSRAVLSGRRSTAGSPTARTPSRCERSIRPATPTSSRPSSPGRSTPSRRTR